MSLESPSAWRPEVHRCPVIPTHERQRRWYLNEKLISESPGAFCLICGGDITDTTTPSPRITFSLVLQLILVAESRDLYFPPYCTEGVRLGSAGRLRTTVSPSKSQSSLRVFIKHVQCPGVLTETESLSLITEQPH